ncbi:hypothetical protein J5U23_00490 [Saccharolobus shibatae B12]|uniref:Uncharacterized protein n=1 Tax=Saccharolobus shibatae (strain ATCC 51178 / DSM 5389 / JCM 8931 / NBRC 15437 / B12) TaxID=523848 RepID=A0A8F5BM07_SACSH|nr:hypothetical protein [Saccharolobus shibatae]QXJ27623.1 hypothetical protein J5U23_00490 [Saccharolobus shibatae B12]
MALLQLRKKEEEPKKDDDKEREEIISIDKLPEEYLRLEYPNDWKYLQKVKGYRVF